MKTPKEITKRIMQQHDETIYYDEGDLYKLEKNIKKWLYIYFVEIEELKNELKTLKTKNL